MEGLKTAREVADYLRKSYTWTVNMLQQGKIRGFKLEGSWRIKERDLEDYLHKHSNRRALR